MDLSLVPHRHTLCPSRVDIGKAQGPGVIGAPDDQTAAMIHQVHLTEPRAVLRPIRPGAHGDLVLEQGARLGEAAGTAHLRATARQEAVDGGVTDP